MSLDSVHKEILAQTNNGQNCPAHDDEHPSFSVNLVKDRILMKCHAGCDINSIVHALGIKLGHLSGEIGKSQNREQPRYQFEAENDPKVRQEKAAKTALDLWKQAKPADPTHEYLTKKKC